MDLTESWNSVIPAEHQGRYRFAEVRNAARILAATNPDEFNDVLTVLADFRLGVADVTTAGGNRSDVSKRLDEAFRELGWREGRHDTEIASVLKIMPWRRAGEREARVERSVVLNEGYKVDNVKGKIACDVEWNAKDGNLDRDVGAYRTLYEAGIIDGAVIITRDHESVKALSRAHGGAMFNTTTTTNIDKLIPRLTRGSGGGCPILAAAVTARCFDAEG